MKSLVWSWPEKAIEKKQHPARKVQHAARKMKHASRKMQLAADKVFRYFFKNVTAT